MALNNCNFHQSTVMRNYSPLMNVLFLFLLITASITRAQSVTLTGTVYENQTFKANFISPQGTIKVYLPDDMAAGDVISGTVLAEPSGKNDKERKKNLAELLKQNLVIAGQKIPVTAAPQNFSFTIPFTNRQLNTPLELMNVSGIKAAELNLPVQPTQPLFSKGVNQGLTPAGNVIVKGQPLALSSNGTFTSSSTFTVSDAAGKTTELKPLCASPRNAVLQLPPDMPPGMLTVKENNNPSAPCKIRLIDIMVRTAKTNLLKGEKSVLQAAIDPKLTEKDSAEAMQIPVMSLDIKNVFPNNVSLEGGDVQRILLPQGNRTDAASWGINRTITGIKPGTFAVNVSLHSDFNVSNDIFHPQKDGLNTPEDFNAWAAALKKDLKNYAARQGNDEAGKAAKTNAERAIENMPRCFNKDKLPDCKAGADMLMRPLNIPKAAATLWLSGFAAYKAAFKNITSLLGGKAEIIDWDIIKNGLAIIKRMGEQLKDEAMKNSAANAKKQIENIQQSGETIEKLQELKNNLDELNKKTDAKTGDDPYYSFYQVTLADIMVSGYSIADGGDKEPVENVTFSYQQVNPVTDLIGFLDPFKKVLFAVPKYRQQLLNMIQAKQQPNGRYLIQSLTAERKPVSYSVAVFNFNAEDIFHKAEELTKTLQCGTGTTEEKPTFLSQDTVKGTPYRFYKDAQCVKEYEGRIFECQPQYDIKWNSSTMKYDSTATGKYIKTITSDRYACQKGEAYCTEMWQIIYIDYIYDDKNCSRLIDIIKNYTWSCH